MKISLEIKFVCQIERSRAVTGHHKLLGAGMLVLLPTIVGAQTQSPASCADAIEKVLIPEVTTYDDWQGQVVGKIKANRIARGSFIELCAPNGRLRLFVLGIWIDRFAVQTRDGGRGVLSPIPDAQRPVGGGRADAIDFSKVQIKTTALGNNTYMLVGEGSNITVAVGTDSIIMVDTQFAQLSDKIKAAIKAISPLPIKYIVNTDFHGDHTGGNANFQKDGAIVIAQDNIRLRLTAGGNKNDTSGYEQPSIGAGGIPKETYTGGFRMLEAGGRKVELHHPYNAHTDGDTWVYFPDANVISTGDIMNHYHTYQQIDFANGGDIRGMIRATDAWLKIANEDTKFVAGDGAVATKSYVAEYNAMIKTARERVEKLVREGKTQDQIVAAKPLDDLNKTWAPGDDPDGMNFLKQIYNSFNRS
jgi:cyclase